MPPDGRGRVLILAGSDSGGGAGVQADIKTVTALGGYATTAITAITVQNTLGVHAIHALPAALVEAQARAVLEDIGADTVKMGMLGSLEVVEAAARLLADYPGLPAVIDPVMAAKDGHGLLDPEALEALLSLLVPRAALLTPNAPEAAKLTGLAVETTKDLIRAGAALLKRGASAVLMKGGHIPGSPVVDVLLSPSGETRFEGARRQTAHTHGTGCTLASACAVGLAQGLTLEDAVARAWRFTAGAIRHAPGFGQGAGPLDHGWMLRPA